MLRSSYNPSYDRGHTTYDVARGALPVDMIGHLIRMMQARATGGQKIRVILAVSRIGQTQLLMQQIRVVLAREIIGHTQLLM